MTLFHAIGADIENTGDKKKLYGMQTDSSFGV